MKQFWISYYDKKANVVKIGGEDDKIIIQGSTPIHAAKSFLKRWNDNRTAKRSNQNDVNLCLSSITFENGKMYLTGQKIWYQLVIGKH